MSPTDAKVARSNPSQYITKIYYVKHKWKQWRKEEESGLPYVSEGDEESGLRSPLLITDQITVEEVLICIRNINVC